jgi:hypothetical protein
MHYELIELTDDNRKQDWPTGTQFGQVDEDGDFHQFFLADRPHQSDTHALAPVDECGKGQGYVTQSRHNLLKEAHAQAIKARMTAQEERDKAQEERDTLREAVRLHAEKDARFRERIDALHEQLNEARRQVATAQAAELSWRHMHQQQSDQLAAVRTELQLLRQAMAKEAEQ